MADGLYARLLGGFMSAEISDAKKFNDAPYILTNEIKIYEGTENAQEYDKIDIIPFAKSIAQFITDCKTPLTIGLQGDWGTGKTSLMNMIKYYLRNEKFHKIDVNTWHYSMFRQNEYLGIVIVKSLVEKLAKIFEENKFDNKEIISSSIASAVSILKKATKVVESIQFSIPLVGGITIADVRKALADNDSLQIENLAALMLEFKQQFSKIIQENIVKKGERIFIFVDDLDRIQPIKAIEVLETIKNFMDVEGCVFVLAVDYEVVQLGIEAKFGKDLQKTSGKSFFDKIIQLPFSMPTASYNIEKYLVYLLVASNFWDKELPAEKDRNFFVDLTEITVGRNPRSIKRAVNYAALLAIIFKEYSNNDVRKSIPNMKLLYAMVCMQIAWPELFEYFVLKPTPETIKELENWDSLEKLPHAKRLFSRISEINQEEVKDNISAFFDTLYEMIDKDGSGVIEDKELKPLLNVLEIVKLTSTRIINKSANTLRVVFRENLRMNQEKNESSLTFFDKIYLKSYFNTSSNIEYKKAGKRYIAIVWNKKQLGSLVTLKTKPLVIRINENRNNILSYLRNDPEADIYSNYIKDIENPYSLTGIGNTEIDWKALLDLNDENKSKEILNKIFDSIITTHATAEKLTSHD